MQRLPPCSWMIRCAWFAHARAARPDAMSALPSPSLAPLTCSRPFLPSIAAAAVCDAPQRGEPRMARPNREAEQTGARPRSNATPRAFPAHQSPTLPTHPSTLCRPKLRAAVCIQSLIRISCAVDGGFTARATTLAHQGASECPVAAAFPTTPHHPHLTPPPKPRAFQMAKLVENGNVDIEMPRHYNEAFRKVCIFKN